MAASAYPLMRLDVALAERGLAISRARAKVLITAGCVLADGKPVTKPSAEVREDSVLTVSGDPVGYVGRGALKLKAAFETFGLCAKGKTAADIGASTGGFTEYLLSVGARKVYAVENGAGQLAEKLQRDARVISMEKYNARYLRLSDFSEPVDLAVMDVSFISQTLILPSLVTVMQPSSFLVSLIKPQFEAGREAIGKGGIVKSADARAEAIRKVVACAASLGLSLAGLIVSPILGGDGNTEYLACFSKGNMLPALAGDAEQHIQKIVKGGDV